MIHDEFSAFAIGQIHEEEVDGDNPGDEEEMIGIDEDELGEDSDEDEDDEDDEEIGSVEEDQ